jgi:hypothetical protein
MNIAKQMLFDLSAWLIQKAPQMDAPAGGETRTSASARAVLYMSMYVYNGPTTPAPPYTPGGDAVVGVVTPNAPATIVTPTLHAGVQFEAGSVDENTVVVVAENPTPYPANCSGPLQTKLCQYPQFYNFTAFPNKKLLKSATFAVCHVNSGENRRPLADHDRFALAHSKPASPDDYTPGSTVRDQNGESIEILPLVEQTFSHCEDNSYATSAVGTGSTALLSRVAGRIQRLITPKTAFAVDLGIGGISDTFSPFNVVDPLGTPDRAVEAVAAAPICDEGTECSATPGSRLRITYTVANIGTAAGAAGPATIHLIGIPQSEDNPGVLLGSVTIPALVPQETIGRSVDVLLPTTLPFGSYELSLRVLDDPLFPEPNQTLVNNRRSTSLTVTGASGPALVRVCATGNGDDSPTVPDVSTAIQMVAAGGTIRICEGVYEVFNVNLRGKTVTIEGEGTAVPTLDAGNNANVFSVHSPSPINTSAVLRRLRLQNAKFAAVGVYNNYGSVVLDGVEFRPTHGVPPNPSHPLLGYAAGVEILAASGRGVTVQNSVFIGGDIGVNANNTNDVLVKNSTFTGQRNAAIHPDGGSLIATGNTISNCGTYSCITIFRGAGGGGTYKLVDNQIEVAAPNRTLNAIYARDAVIEITGNTITGSGNARTQEGASIWGLAIALEDAEVIVNSNEIAGAWGGIGIFGSTSGTAANNVVSNVRVGVDVSSTGAFSITRSDFSNYTEGLYDLHQTSSFTCNWWGSVNGPVGVAGTVPRDSYFPWALAPIARNSNTVCDSN